MDILADSLTKLRNAGMRTLPTVFVKKTKLIQHIMQILQQEGYIHSCAPANKDPYALEVKMRYRHDQPAILGIRRVSKLSRRVYVSKERIPRILNNHGISILSTSKGVMTGSHARKLGVGGEVLCYVW